MVANSQGNESAERIPAAWREAYRKRSPEMLAIDVTRAFDQHFILERSLRRTKLVLGTLTALCTFMAAVLALLKFL